MKTSLSATLPAIRGGSWVLIYIFGPPCEVGLYQSVITLYWTPLYRPRDWNTCFSRRWWRYPSLMSATENHCSSKITLKIAKSWIPRAWLSSMWIFKGFTWRAQCLKRNTTVYSLYNDSTRPYKIALSAPKSMITPKSLQCLNTYQIFLSVLTLADVCNGCGTLVLSHSLKSRQPTACQGTHKATAQPNQPFQTGMDSVTPSCHP